MGILKGILILLGAVLLLCGLALLEVLAGWMDGLLALLERAALGLAEDEGDAIH